jgi:hypothetical protein
VAGQQFQIGDHPGRHGAGMVQPWRAAQACASASLRGSFGRAFSGVSAMVSTVIAATPYRSNAMIGTDRCKN